MAIYNTTRSRKKKKKKERKEPNRRKTHKTTLKHIIYHGHTTGDLPTKPIPNPNPFPPTTVTALDYSGDHVCCI